MSVTVSNTFLAAVKEYGKIESSDDVLKPIIGAAIRKCEIRTGVTFDEADELYSLAVKMLSLDWYDHRGGIDDESIKDMPIEQSVVSILNTIAIDEEDYPKKVSS